jgi:hypothetical protein
MSKLSNLINLIFFISLISIISTQETNNEKKSNIKWTSEALLKYTLKHHGKEKYFICDPLGYISEEEKEVIYYRLETIYNKLNITSVFFVLDKISMEGLNITSYDNDDEFEDDDIAQNNKNKNDTAKSVNTTINGTIIKTEEDKKREFQIYIAEIRKKLFNRKIFLDRESKCLIGIYTVEEVGTYLYVGKDNRDLVNENEINTLLEGKEYLIEQRNLYFAVDNLFSNFAYRFAPSKLDQFNKFMGVMGEIMGIGAIIFSYFLMNRNKEEPQAAQPEQNKNKKEEEKKEEKSQEKKEENKGEEKQKKD